MKPPNSVSRRVTLLASVLLFAIGSALHAQGIFGTWQGTLPAGPIKRVVLKVTKANDGSLRGTFIVIDHSANGLPLQSLKYTAPDLSFQLADITYHGKLSADGNSIAGTWTRPNESYALTLARATPETTWTYTGPADAPPMAATADPSFEVATIKPTAPGAGNGHAQFILGRRQFKASSCNARELIKIAYDVRGRQVDGGPAWIGDQMFDVVADTDSDIPGTPSEAQTRVMVRKLLEDRFGLKVHLAQREFSVYALTVEKTSAKLMKSDAAPNLSMAIVGSQNADGEFNLQFVHATMKEFAGLMMNFIQSHQIVDETGLQGQYDFSIVTPKAAFQPQGPDDLPDPAFVQAIQPLGLKFVLKKEPLEVVVVDHLDTPSAN